jgi:hypothetical protein
MIITHPYPSQEGSFKFKNQLVYTTNYFTAEIRNLKL